MTDQEPRHEVSAEEETELFQRMERALRARALLESAEEIAEADQRRLLLDLEQGAEARTRLAEIYLPFADRKARECARSLRGAFELDVLKSHAYVGLLELIHRYRLDEGVPFSGFASRYLKREIKRLAFEERNEFPRSEVDLRRKARAVQLDLRKELGREPSREQIAEEMGLLESEVAPLLEPLSHKPIQGFEESSTGEEWRSTLPEPLVDRVSARGMGGGYWREQADGSIRDFFDPLLKNPRCTADQRRALEALLHKLTDDESLLEGLHGHRPSTLDWRSVVGAMALQKGDAGADSQEPGWEWKDPAHPHGTDALDRRNRRKRVIDGRIFFETIASRGF